MKELLLKAKFEIIQLRKSNELMSAQLAIVDVFAAALGLKPEQRGETIDIVWEIERELEDAERLEKMPSKEKVEV
jgi:hypothetical protein